MRTFTYTSLKRLLSANNPESGTIGYTYDNNGNLLTRTDARSIVTTMAYDGLNRITTKSYSDGITPNVTYCYDGRTWTGTYAQCTGSRAAPFLGRLREEGSSASSTKFTNYDSLGHVMASAQTTGGTAYNFGYQYKLNDGLKQITYPSNRQVNYAYTGAGRVASVSGLQSGTTTNYTSAATPISYAAQGATQSLTLGNNLVESATFNGRLQPIQIQVPGLLTLGLDFGTTQNNGNVLSQTIVRGSQTWTQSYPATCYDGVNRLTCASESGAGTWSQSYGYDNFGNRWVSDNTNLPSLSNQVPNGNWFSGNKVTNSPHGTWTYDNVGNLKAMSGMPGWGFDYDAENRQISAVTANSPTTTYKYDGEGRRISKTWNGQTTTFVYDAFGNLAAEYGGPVDSHGTHYLTSDHLGSTRLVTNSSGAAVKCYDYLPFGEEIGTTAGRPSCFGSGSYPVSGGATNVEFTGKERDAETGLDFFESRYFSSAQGRFTSPDAMMGKPEWLVDPQRWNRYAYVRNNPLKYIDPNGEDLVVYYSLGSDVSDADREWFNKNKSAILGAIQAKYEKAGVKNVSLRDQSTLSKDQLAALDKGTPFGVSRLTFVGKEYPGLGQAPMMGVLGYAHPDGKGIAGVFLDTFPKVPPAGCDQACMAANVGAHELGHTLGMPHLGFFEEMADRFRQRPAMLGGTETRPDLMTGSMGTPTQPLYFKPGTNERTQRAIQQLNRIGDMTPKK